jgi:hypothetical protein
MAADSDQLSQGEDSNISDDISDDNHYRQPDEQQEEGEEELLQRQQQQQQQQQQLLLLLQQQQANAIPNPNDVDDLLSRELMQLSLQTRNNIQEEIHGVKCLAPVETPELLSSSLRRLEAKLDQIPQSQLADAFVRAWQMGERSFVSTVEFKLRFLRKCLFDVNAAVDSIIEFCHKMQSAFGDAALQRSIVLHRDFTKRDIRLFKKGRYQLMPFRDRSGRRILVVLPSEEVEQMEPTLRVSADDEPIRGSEAA